MKRFAAFLAIVLVACAVLVGCAKKTTTVTHKPTDTKVRLAFITNNTADFWIFARRGCEKAISELPSAELEFRLTNDATAAEQRRIIDDLVSRGVKGIAISPIDPANQKPFIDELSATTAVVTCDSDIPGSKRLCYIGTDNVDAGRQAGAMIKEVLPNGGRIMLFVGKKDTQNAKERIQGIEEAIKGTKIEIIDVRTDNVDPVQAKANVSDAIVKYPDLACCVGLWNYNGPAILNAVKDAGILGKMKIVCFDENAETLNGVKDGYIYGTVVQQPFEFGYQSMKMLAAVAAGDKSTIPASGQMIIPTLNIKQADAPAFIDKVKALLGK
jgi:ribose transport system substrate-binding protein